MQRPRQTPLRSVVLGLLLSVGASGCQLYDKLYEFFHPAEDEQAGEGAITVTVVPDTGISILVDGVRVATTSPYRGEKLASGPHTLEVRAMGYHTLTLPIVVRANDDLKIPVSLRSRPPVIEEPIREEKPVPRRPEPKPQQSELKASLPPGVEPVRLHIAGNPEPRVRLDGAVSANNKVTLERVGGSITIDDVKLNYRVAGAGLLLLSIESSGSLWQRDGIAYTLSTEFRLDKGATRLTRTRPDGSQSVILIRRQ